MIKSGLRIGELTALYRSDIDRKNGFIHVRRTITRNKVGGYTVGTNAKTQSDMRDIPLTDEVFNIIREQEKLNNMIFGTVKSGRFNIKDHICLIQPLSLRVRNNLF